MPMAPGNVRLLKRREFITLLARADEVIE